MDTREKRRTTYALRKLKIPFEKQALKAGDIMSDECVAERKTVRDLIGSIRGPKGKPGRFFDQMEKLRDYANETGKIPFLFVSGDLEDTKAWFAKRGLKLNENSVMGALASAIVRYGINVFAMFADDKEMLYCLHSVFEKVSNGKAMIPRRRQLERGLNKKVALWCTILRVRPTIVRQLIKKYKSLENFLKVLKKEPSKLEVTAGVGPGTVKKWKSLLE